MSTIVTITFSPCIDKSTSVAFLAPDIKMSCTSVKLEPGGGGINVARAIGKLGGSAKALYSAGGCTGKEFTQLMHDENVPTKVIESNFETRENIIIVDESNGKQYRFGMPMTPLNEAACNQFLTLLNEEDDLAYMIISGSIPPGVPLTIFDGIADIARQKNAKLIVDTKGEPLKYAINAGVFLIKPNLGELSALVGKKELKTTDIVNEARKLIQSGKCEVVVVSMGAEGAMLVTSTIAKQIKPPTVERKSTVGAGDSMVAGIVFALDQGSQLVDAIQYGVACGTAATLNHGTELCKKEDVAFLLPKVEIIDWQ
jgi:6-phosphofructokinase 2